MAIMTKTLSARLRVRMHDEPDYVATFMSEAADALDAAAAREARLREALEWLDYHADNQDMSHLDFRVEGTLKARAALEDTKAEQAPAP
jgi:hypothetical protein